MIKKVNWDTRFGVVTKNQEERHAALKSHSTYKWEETFIDGYLVMWFLKLDKERYHYLLSRW